jgi:3-oxoacyl-[acyl-carrier protein] reductase
MKGIENRVALVTAAAGDGIGGATARRLTEEGAPVVLTDVYEARLARAIGELSNTYGSDRILGLVLDASDRAVIDAVLTEATTRMGPIQILVNNAGVVADVRSGTAQAFTSLSEISAESWTTS